MWGNCSGSLLLCQIFPSISKPGRLPNCGARASLPAAASPVQSTASRARTLQQLRLWAQQFRLLGWESQAQQLRHTASVAPRHVESSQIRDQTWVSYIGRWILYHWATWEAQVRIFLVRGSIHQEHINVNVPGNRSVKHRRQNWQN